MKNQFQIQVADDGIQVTLPDGDSFAFPRVSLPEPFLRWQSEARLGMFDVLREQGAEGIRMQPAHLPVLATVGERPFPVNLASRGVGLLPKAERLEEFISLFEEARARAEGRPWPDTLPLRVEAARAFYGQLEHFDPWTLGGLEIFEGRTARNLQRYPMASLLYTGEAPRFPSYQFNGVVTFVGPEDPCYRFLRAARELFAFDPFHVPQIRYPYGYLFHAVEVRDKTPYPKR